MQQIITLITDFGLEDSFVGVMKGVIYSINPDVKVVDINHNIERQSVMQGAVNLENSYSYFPEGTVHIAVVDPGVGSGRRPLIVNTDNHYFVGPDNGIFSYLYENSDTKVYEITETDYFLENVSSSFHGRDIFSPVAAQLSKKPDPENYGRMIEDYVNIEINRPVKENNSITGDVIYVDVFGNMMSNIANTDVDYNDEIFINDNPIGKLSSSYSEGLNNNIIAIHGSNGTVEIAINRGRASDRYKTLPRIKVLKS